MEETVFELIRERLGEAKVRELARVLTEGRWTHDLPITVGVAKELGPPVRTVLPEAIYEMMRLSP